MLHITRSGDEKWEGKGTNEAEDMKEHTGRASTLVYGSKMDGYDFNRFVRNAQLYCAEIISDRDVKRQMCSKRRYF